MDFPVSGVSLKLTNLLFVHSKDVESGRSCVWWDFDMNNYKGGWSNKGCVYDGKVNGRDVCLCDHLTNFAVLIVSNLKITKKNNSPI